MKVTIEAKTFEEAKKMALTQLGVKEEKDLEFNVIEEESKGIFGFGSKNSKIEAVLKKPYTYFAKEFLTGLMESMKIKDYQFECFDDSKDYNINVKVPLEVKSYLIGKFGKTLNAIEYLARIYVNKKVSPIEKKAKFNVHVDIENYRQEKLEKLERLANRLAEKVLVSGKSIEMKPMSARERKLIHMNFKNDPNINTFSKGQEPYRKIVISTKKK